MENLLLDELPVDVQLVRAKPRPLGVMEGINFGDLDAALLIGFHSGATDWNGVLSHTLTGGIRELKINGQIASETVASAEIAGHYDVAIVMVSDDAYAEHAQSVLESVETAMVKDALSLTSARS